MLSAALTNTNAAAKNLSLKMAATDFYKLI